MKKFKQFHDCHIKHNVKRRHVLHELIEQYRSKKEHFDKELVLEAVRFTINALHVQIRSSSSSTQVVIVARSSNDAVSEWIVVP